MGAQGAAPADGRVRYRPSTGQKVPIFLLATLFVAGGGSMALAFHVWAAVPAVVALGFVLLYLGHSVGISLTPQDAIVHSFRRRRIPWREIRSVEVERSPGTRVIVLCETDGRRTRLRAPSSGFLNWDRRFEQKYRSIGRWWLAHRGDG